VHCPGKENIVADCLSRAPVEPLPNEPDQLNGSRDIFTPVFGLNYFPNLLKNIERAQLQDSEVIQIKNQLQSQTSSNNSSFPYFVLNNIVYKSIVPFETAGAGPPWPGVAGQLNINSPRANNSSNNFGSTPVFSSNTNNNNNCRDQGPVVADARSRNGSKLPSRNIFVPYLPKSMRLDILLQFHDAPESGHMGVKKTKEAIKQRFYWNNMNTDIQNFVKSCKVCQEYKVERQKPKGLMGDAPQATSVFETLFIDFIGPLPVSRYYRNKFCLVVIDQLSRWVELFPMSSQTAKKVVQVLEDQVFCRFGSPKNILSDNAQNFVGKLMKKLCKEWDIRHIQISAYHPCPNRAERVNADLVRMIASYLENAHGN
jgi:hypothetical protein